MKKSKMRFRDNDLCRKREKKLLQKYKTVNNKNKYMV